MKISSSARSCTQCTNNYSAGGKDTGEMPAVVQCRPADCSIRPFKSRFTRSNIYEQLISRTMARARCIQVGIQRPRDEVEKIDHKHANVPTCYRITLYKLAIRI